MALKDRLGPLMLKMAVRAPLPVQRWLAAKDDDLKPMPAAQGAVLALMNAADAPPISKQPLAQARGGYRVFAQAMDTGWPKGVGVSHTTIPTSAGVMKAEISHPRTAPRGIFLYIHGGGWTLGAVETHQPVCRQLALKTDCKVISIDYRLAPEHPYPAAVDDCWDAYMHLRTENPGLPIFCAGDSAGGNLSAVMAVRAITRKTKKPDGLLLIYPGTELDADTKSMETFDEDYFLTRDAMAFFRDQYMPDPSRMSEPEASPALFDNLSAFPPTWIGTAGYDPLQDDGKAFVKKLKAAGVQIHHRHDDQLIHGYCHMIGPVAEARAAISDAAAFAVKVLEGGATKAKAA